MAYTDIDICNLALSHLGDIATVANIVTPSSAQEKYCARFYPLARDLLQEMHLWGFLTTRATLAASAVTPPSTWQYAFTAPAGVINYIEVLDPNARDDYSTPVVYSRYGGSTAPIANVGVFTPQPFAVESDGTGAGIEIIYCNLSPAVLRYTQQVTDPSKFPPTFVRALSYRLAAMLAGPIIKGDTGMKVAIEMEKMAEKTQADAEVSDANQRNIKPAQSAPWITSRG
jgi:hypothetical protein